VLEKSARLIAASPFVREQALADHRDRVTVVPPGVDAERFAPDGGPEGGRILFVGPLSSTYEWKGLDTLWEAFQRVRKRRPEARLTIVGEGDRVAEFQARSSRVDGALEVLGRVSDRALVDAYQRSRVVVLPSTSEAESFGMVLAEANACGRPVVGSEIGGIPGFVDHRDNGLLARPGDPEHLADRLIEVLDDDELAARLGRRGRQRVLADHDWDRLASRTESVLAEALRAGPP
jgi:rhamnosyl/mannosyltransferase